MSRARIKRVQKEQLELFRLTCAISDLISIYFQKIHHPTEKQTQMTEYFASEKVRHSKELTQHSKQFRTSRKSKQLQEIKEEEVIDIYEPNPDPDPDTFCVIL